MIAEEKRSQIRIAVHSEFEAMLFWTSQVLNSSSRREFHEKLEYLVAFCGKVSIILNQQLQDLLTDEVLIQEQLNQTPLAAWLRTISELTEVISQAELAFSLLEQLSSNQRSLNVWHDAHEIFQEYSDNELVKHLQKLYYLEYSFWRLWVMKWVG